MGMRFVVFGLILAAILASAFVSLQSGQSSVLEIFFWLGAILVTCGVALWPFAGRDQRAELELSARPGRTTSSSGSRPQCLAPPCRAAAPPVSRGPSAATERAGRLTFLHTAAA